MLLDKQRQNQKNPIVKPIVWTDGQSINEKIGKNFKIP